MIRFEPFAYDHAAYLIGRTPWEVSRNAELLFQAHLAAVDRYGLDECVVGIDIYNVEAEIFGCIVAEPDGYGSPAILKPVCITNKEILRLKQNTSDQGRFPWILETAVRLRASRPECTFRIPVTGPFTLFGHLFGLDNLLCEVLLNEADARDCLAHLAELLLDFVQSAGVRGLEVVFFESSASPPLLSPNLFRSHLLPVLKNLLDEASHSTGARPQLIMGGNTLPIADMILSTRPSYVICPVETDQPAFLAKVQQFAAETRTRVNMRPEVFLDASPDRAILEAVHTLRLASILENSSVGVILPLAASPELVVEVSEFVKNNQPIVSSD